MQTFNNIDEAVAPGAPLFAICEAHALTYPPSSTKVDLATQFYDALFALKAGEPLKQVVGCIRDVNVRGEPETHPAADKARAELKRLYIRTRGWGELKQALLEHYAGRDPHSFFQFDGFPDVVGDSVMYPDHEGDGVFSSVSQELMTGAPAVRVLITPGTPPEKANALLHKIADHIVKDGFALHQAELERRATFEESRNQTSEDDDYDKPF